MESTLSILISVDKETHRRASIRAEELRVSLPEWAAALLVDAVNRVNTSEDSLGHSSRAAGHSLDQVIGEIRAAYPGFRAADNLPRDELYGRVDGERT